MSFQGHSLESEDGVSRPRLCPHELAHVYVAGEAEVGGRRLIETLIGNCGTGGGDFGASVECDGQDLGVQEFRYRQFFLECERYLVAKVLFFMRH